MPRGYMVDSVKIIKRFNLFIVAIDTKGQSFEYYETIYLSKTNTLIGTWGSRFGKPYKDYIMHYGVPENAKLIKRTKNYLFFKTNNQT